MALYKTLVDVFEGIKDKVLLKELNVEAQDKYGMDYYRLCDPRKRTIRGIVEEKRRRNGLQ